MIDYWEILRLDSLGYSRRRISSLVNSSHHTVEDTLKAAHDTGIAWPLEDVVTNAELQGLLFPWKYVSDSVYAMPDFAYIHWELAKSGVTLTLLWEDYCTKVRSNDSVPYSYTQFGEKYRRWARVTKATISVSLSDPRAGDIAHQAFRRVFDVFGVRFFPFPGAAFKLIDDVFDQHHVDEQRKLL